MRREMYLSIMMDRASQVRNYKKVKPLVFERSEGGRPVCIASLLGQGDWAGACFDSMVDMSARGHLGLYFLTHRRSLPW